MPDKQSFQSVIDRFLSGELDEASLLQLMETMERSELDGDTNPGITNLETRREQQLEKLLNKVHQSEKSSYRKPSINWVRHFAITCFGLLFTASIYFYLKPASLVHRCTQADLRVGEEPVSAMLAALYVEPQQQQLSKVSCVNTTEDGYLRFESKLIESESLRKEIALDQDARYLVFEDQDINQLLAVLKKKYQVDFTVTGQLPEQQFSGFISTGLNLKMVVQLLVSSGLFEVSIRGKQVHLSSRI
ncbi:MAG: DUF4974 domain-containing protein [Flavihumibacter sp.]|jgi:hypothetical protein|nr:DUF4974 domain-containing protein [Flavihumibacter sp.]